MAATPTPATAAPQQPFHVQVPAYSGPFDLLLHLILRDEVDLYEIKVGDIVDAYLAELQHMERLNLEVATEFLLIAAKLVELKSKRLLPDDDTADPDEELLLWSDRDLLLARLLECATFKRAAQQIQHLTAHASLSYPRMAGMEDRFLDHLPDLLDGVTPADIHAAFLRATAPRPQPRVSLDHITPVSITVGEVVQDLLATLPDAGRVRFRELTDSLVDRLEVVVHFLAVLELYKQGLVEVSQTATFGQILITWSPDPDADTPAPAAIPVDVYDG